MSKGNILVVDDDRFFRDLYKDMLLEEGFSVKVAADGMVAAVLVRDELFDVVLMDMVMPDWNGIKTMGEVRKVQPDLDVIMVTHVSEIETAVEAFDEEEAEREAQAKAMADSGEGEGEGEEQL